MDTATQAPVLELRDLRTHFSLDEGTLKAVDGVSLTVHQGQTLGIIGESGCGKSVTAQSILRIVPTPGRIISGDILLHRDGDPPSISPTWTRSATRCGPSAARRSR